MGKSSPTPPPFPSALPRSYANINIPLCPACYFPFFFYSLFTTSALAQAPPPPCINGPWFNQSTCHFADKVQQAPESEIFGERYPFAQINWIINSLVLTFNPFLGFSENQLQDVKDSISVFLQAQGPSSPPFAQLSGLGAPGIFAFAATEIYSSRPASGILSINDTLAKFDL